MTSWLLASLVCLQSPIATRSIAYGYVAEPGGAYPPDSIGQELSTLRKEERGGFVRLKSGHFVSLEGGQPPIVFSPELEELKRFDIAERVFKEMKSIPREPVFPLIQLGPAVAECVLEKINRVLPLQEPANGQLPPTALCAISSTMRFELTDGNKTVVADYRDGEAFNQSLSPQERSALVARLKEGPIWGLDPSSPEGRQKWERYMSHVQRVGGTVGLNVRVRGVIPQRNRTSVYRDAIDRYSLLVDKRRAEVNAIAEPWIKEMARRFAQLHSAKPESAYSQLPARWQDDLRVQIESQSQLLGFTSSEDVMPFLESAKMTKGSTAGIDVIIYLKPMEANFAVSLWPL